MVDNYINPNKFIDFKHIIEYIPFQQNKKMADITIGSRPNLNVSLIVNDDIDKKMGVLIVGNQIVYWNNVTRSGHAQVTVYKTKKEGFML